MRTHSIYDLLYCRVKNISKIEIKGREKITTCSILREPVKATSANSLVHLRADKSNKLDQNLNFEIQEKLNLSFVNFKISRSKKYVKSYFLKTLSYLTWQYLVL